MKKPRIHVTDHALVRYCERVLGMSADALRAHIAAQVETGVEHGASGVRVGPHVYKLDGDTVVTIVPASEAGKQTGSVKHPKVDRDA